MVVDNDKLKRLLSTASCPNIATVLRRQRGKPRNILFGIASTPAVLPTGRLPNRSMKRYSFGQYARYNGAVQGPYFKW